MDVNAQAVLHMFSSWNRKIRKEEHLRLSIFSIRGAYIIRLKSLRTIVQHSPQRLFCPFWTFGARKSKATQGVARMTHLISLWFSQNAKVERTCLIVSTPEALQLLGELPRCFGWEDARRCRQWHLQLYQFRCDILQSRPLEKDGTRTTCV